ncbi:pentatricopeptide repeat-containing protein [Tanacetum coccineum]
MDELIAHVFEKTYACGAIRAENQNLLSTISELKTRLETTFHLLDLDNQSIHLRPIFRFDPIWGCYSKNHKPNFPNSGSFYDTPDSCRECGVPAETMYYVPTDNRAKFWYLTDYGMFHFCIEDSEHDWREGSEQYARIEKYVFDEMIKTLIEPDIHAFNILAKGYVRASEPEKSESLLQVMKALKVSLNIFIFTTIISGWCSERMMDYATRVFDQTGKMGISPNLKTFKTLIWGYGEAKQPWKAEELLQVMEEKGIVSTKDTVEFVAEAWCGICVTNEAKWIMDHVDEHDDASYTKSNDDYTANEIDDSGIMKDESLKNVINKENGSPTIKSRSRIIVERLKFSQQSYKSTTRKSIYD